MKELRGRYEGRWRLPEQRRDRATGGALTLGGEPGGVLRLTGALPWDLAKRSQPQNRSGVWYDLPVINGDTVDGDQLTLLRNLVTSTRTVAGGTQSQELLVGDVLVGAHLVEEQNPVFDSVQFELTHLADWSRPSGVGPVTESGDEENFVITYRRTPPHLATVVGLGEVALGRTADYKFDHEVNTLRHYAAFAVRFAKPRHLDDVFDDAIAPLQNLLTFADARASRPGPVSVTSPGLRVHGEQAHLGVFRTGVEPPENKQNKEATPYQGIFVLEACPIPFGQLIARWFDLASRLGPIIDLYLTLDYAPPVHTQTQFMNMCQAAEGYHRTISTGTLMDPEEHKELVRGLVNGCPDDRREWLRGLLAHSNEPSFKRRIDELIDRAGPALRPLIAARPKYAVAMREYRISYAHWLSTEPLTANVRAKLVDLITVTRFMLAACFLQDLGWSTDQVHAAFEKNWLFIYSSRQGQQRT